MVDESTGIAVSNSLRKMGYDSVSIIDIMKGIEDADIIERSKRENRVIVTNDKVNSNYALRVAIECVGDLIKVGVQICAYVYAHTMTKIVSLSEKAYKALKRLKRSGESFSDVVSRLAGTEEPRSLLLFAGKWVGDDLNEVFKLVADEREKSASREVVF